MNLGYRTLAAGARRSPVAGRERGRSRADGSVGEKSTRAVGGGGHRRSWVVEGHRNQDPDCRGSGPAGVRHIAAVEDSRLGRSLGVGCTGPAVDSFGRILPVVADEEEHRRTGRRHHRHRRSIRDLTLSELTVCAKMYVGADYLQVRNSQGGVVASLSWRGEERGVSSFSRWSWSQVVKFVCGNEIPGTDKKDSGRRIP